MQEGKGNIKSFYYSGRQSPLLWYFFFCAEMEHHQTDELEKNRARKELKFVFGCQHNLTISCKMLRKGCLQGNVQKSTGVNLLKFLAIQPCCRL